MDALAARRSGDHEGAAWHAAGIRPASHCPDAALYDLLPGEKEIIEFTQAQGANFHCQPTGRQLTHTQMLDWLADHLPSQQA